MHKCILQNICYFECVMAMYAMKIERANARKYRNKIRNVEKCNSRI